MKMTNPKIKLKKSMKWALFATLTLATAQLSLVAAFAQDQDTAPLREESTELDNLYQQKVTSILNNLMNPSDYTLVISTTLKNDEQKLKELREEREKRFLPGLNMNADPLGYADTNNILLELKQKAEIQVILADNVPADRDAIVKEVLKAKLKLNEESGDTITVVRATRTPASVSSPTPDKLPELSGRMIAFWIIVALLALTGLTLWLFKRREKMKADKKDEQEEHEGQSQGGVVAEGHAQKEEEEEEKPREKTPEEIEAERDALEMRLAFAKGELVKLVQDYPSIVCRAAEEFATQGRLNETVNYMEALGWDQAKRLFKEMDGRIWTRVGAALRDRDEDPTLEETFNAVHVFHRFALSFVLERAGRDSENPFSFVFQLTESQRIDLLTQESAENIAFIAIYCSGPQMGELLKGLEQEKQNDVLLNITKIRHLPELIIRESVDALVMRLERIKADPSVYVDGPMLAADFMKSLSPAREEELYQTLLSAHPEEAEKLRRVRVMFQDIPYYPNEMVRKIVEAFESEDIMKALVGYDSGFAESFLSLLPTKKALMIQNDLYHMVEYPPVSQCAENRRKICNKIEQEFESQRFSVADFWKQFDNPSSLAGGDAPEGGFTDEVTAVDAPSMLNRGQGPLIDTYPPAVFDEFEDDQNGGQNGGEGGGNGEAA